jgi:hypothetical protein
LAFSNMPETLHHDLALHHIPREITDHDITIYVQQELKHIWASEQDIRRLVQKAGGLFIWAATACRFIRTGRRVLHTRISLALQGGVRSPERALDGIYTRVLKESICGDYNEEEKGELFENFRSIVGAIAILFEPLSAAALAMLLQTPKPKVEVTLGDLHSILEVAEHEACPIRLLHPSFRDFLLTKERCQEPELYVDEMQAHSDLANRCLRLMSNGLKKDICDLRVPGALVSEIDSRVLEQYIPTELQYACRHWVEHIRQGKNPLSDESAIHLFLKKHFLHWVEGLSLMRKMSDGLHAMIALETMLKVSHFHFPSMLTIAILT